KHVDGTCGGGRMDGTHTRFGGNAATIILGKDREQVRRTQVTGGKYGVIARRRQRHTAGTDRRACCTGTVLVHVEHVVIGRRQAIEFFSDRKQDAVDHFRGGQRRRSRRCKHF